MKDNIQKFLPMTIVLLFSIGAIFPLFHAGFYPMHDDTQVARVFEIGTSLRDGMFPVRWVADLGYGYGYPIFNFYAPLAYYVGGLFTLFSLDALLATKLMIGIGVILSGLSMYILAKKIWGVLGGLLSSIVYVYAPYHAVDLYVRGDIAELWAYAFFPLALLGIWLLYKKPSIKAVIIGAIGFTGIIVSHNLSAFLFAPFFLFLLVIAGIFSKQKKKTITYEVFLLILAFLLSAWYTLPVFAEMKFTNVLSQIGGGADFHDHFVCLAQLWQSPWGYGGSVPGCVDGFSFMIGKVQILFAVFSFLVIPFLWRRQKEKVLIILLSLMLGLLSIFLLLPNSKFIWEAISQMAFLQYPWRYLLLVSLFLSLAGGAVISVFTINKKVLALGVGIVCVGITFFSLKYFVPEKYLAVSSLSYTNTKQLEWTTSKISDEYMSTGFEKPQNSTRIPSQLAFISDGKVSILENTVQKKIIQIQSTKRTILHFNVAYFPTWHAVVDGKRVPIQPLKNGIAIDVPQGNHLVGLSFQQTSVELLGDFLTIAGTAMLILGILYGRKRI